MPKVAPRVRVLNAILKHTPPKKLANLLFREHKGFLSMTTQELAVAAETLLPSAIFKRLANPIAELKSFAVNRSPRKGDSLYCVLVTRDVGTESAEVFVNANSEAEADEAARDAVDNNEIVMNFNEGNPRDPAYLSADDCIEKQFDWDFTSKGANHV